MVRARLDAGAAERMLGDHGRREAIGDVTPVVAVGGSAGALGPLQAMLETIPADAEPAWVILVHRTASDPDRLPSLLERHSALPVKAAADGARVAAGHVYVAPASAEVTVRDGRFAIDRREAPHPIDALLRSLASDLGRRAYGVLLSGAGSDGVLGLKAIAGQGGFTAVQDPATAEFSGMPRSAIESGAVHRIHAPAELAPQILEYARRIRDRGEEPEGLDETLERVLTLLSAHAGHDFAGYRRGTLRRRFARRLDLLGIDEPGAYLDHVKGNPNALEVLLQDLLIGVTSFFRDPAAFAALKRALLERLRGKPDDEEVRVWIPGCATGQEAYSIAIVVLECMEELGRHRRVEIFATDVDPRAIDVARAGRYPEGVAAEIDPQRLERFFAREHAGWRVGKHVRSAVIFGAQNALTDPPFTKLDLLSCRNLLIYLRARQQRRLLTVFHHALRPDGLLFLGSAEALGDLTHHFAAVDTPARVFAKRDVPAPRVLEPSMLPPLEPRPSSSRPSTVALAHRIDGALLSTFVPPTVVVARDGRVVHVHGPVHRYLHLGHGEPTLNVFDMAPPGLREQIGVALRQVCEEEAPVSRTRVEVVDDGAAAPVDLEVRPLREAASGAPLYVVSLREPWSTVAAGETAAGDEDPTTGEAELRRELARTQRMLRAAVEEYQATNEELRLINEELQSANEALSTSKEELQTLNVELHTINEEAQERIDALCRTQDDLTNLLDSTHVATLFLDDELRIQRFTPQARAVANLIPEDVGRPLSDLAMTIDYADLEASARRVLETLQVEEAAVWSRDGQRRYLMRIQPYRTSANVIEGLVLTFVDVTELEQAERRLERTRLDRQRIFEHLHEAFVVLDEDLRYVTANAAFHARFGVPIEGPAGEPLAALLGDGVDGAELEHRIREHARSASALEPSPFETSLGGRLHGLDRVVVHRTDEVARGERSIVMFRDRGAPAEEREDG